MTMRTSPLPAPLNTDPAFIAAKDAAATYMAAAAGVRGDMRLTDLAKAEQITQLWEDANASISAAWQDLTARRTARLAELQSLVPIGPNVPADASAADAAVLHQIFRAALDQARKADGEPGLRAMLADAQRFNDDTARRAVLTVAIDAGQPRIVQEWCEQVGLSAELAELVSLRSTLAGHGDIAGRLFETQGFRLLARPGEVLALPGLLRAAEQSRRDANRRPAMAWH